MQHVHAVALMLGALLPLAAQDASPARPPSVRAVAEATVSAKPDRARIHIGVVTQAATAAEAGAQNARQLETVLAQLRKALGAGAEVKTASYYLNPNYRFPKEGGQPSISGYTAGNTVQVTLDDLATVGKVIDAATQSGANQIQSLEFLLKDDRGVRTQALREAVARARANAEAMATALGMRASRILSVEEGEPAVVRPVGNVAMMNVRAAADSPISPGRLEIRAVVTVTMMLE